jgi:hypothetical protein
MKTVEAIATESAIWNRMLRSAGPKFSVAAARSILRLEFAPEDRTRMRVLAAKVRAGSLTSTEHNEITDYERAGNLLALMKSKARQRLKAVSVSNG